MLRSLAMLLIVFGILTVIQSARAWQDESQTTQPADESSQQNTRESRIQKLIDETDVTEPPLATIPAVPKREFVVVSSDEPYKLPLFKVDADLLQLKFSAQLTLLAEPFPGQNELSRVGYSEAQWLFPDPRIPNIGGPRPGPALSLFSRIRLRTSSENRVTRGVSGLDALLRDLNERTNSTISMEEFINDLESHFLLLGGNGNSSVQWIVLGSDEDQILQKVQRLLNIYDQAIWVTHQNELATIANAYRDGLIQQTQGYSKAIKTYEVTNEEWEKVKDLEDISEASLTDLKTQRQLIDVDVAGIDAKITACEKMLSKVTGTAVDEIIRIKTTAEIDLVEKTARRDKLAELIDQAGLRAKVAVDYKSAVGRLQADASAITSLRANFDGMIKVQQDYQPVTIENNRITVQPIKWENATP